VEGGRAIGVDLGGTKILAGVVDREGRVGETIERPTPTESQSELLEAIAEVVNELRSPQVEAVGLGAPVRVDLRTGLAIGAVNLPLRDLRLDEELGRRVGLPVAVVNDGSAAALGEFRLGAGRGSDTFVLITLGTGVGGGVVIDHALYRGWSEIGHMVIVEDGYPCQGACTGRGHVESYCSGTAADRVAREVLGPGASARDLVEQRHPALTAIGHHLGAAVASVQNLFDPDIVVIGGGFGVSAGELLLEPVRTVIRREALAPAGERVRLAVSELHGSAGLIGAGLVGFEALA
jgi:glucokinase